MSPINDYNAFPGWVPYHSCAAFRFCPAPPLTLPSYDSRRRRCINNDRVGFRLEIPACATCFTWAAPCVRLKMVANSRLLVETRERRGNLRWRPRRRAETAFTAAPLASFKGAPVGQLSTKEEALHKTLDLTLPNLTEQISQLSVKVEFLYKAVELATAQVPEGLDADVDLGDMANLVNF
ncbi:hypothetical protein LZ30DRAFT_739914 [Colletotrichum cereale]|nr:hypothetical protein LZ30DRAFT_739914 [Colletotrichum cereale]